MSLIVPEALGQQIALCRILNKRVRKYFEDEQHRKEFEVWYLEVYGELYEWKLVADVNKQPSTIEKPPSDGGKTK